MVKKLLLLGALTCLVSASFAEVDKVYIAKNSTKYHLSKNCPALKNAKEVKLVSMSTIRAKHITMCELCKAAKAKAAKPMKAGSKPEKAMKTGAKPGVAMPGHH